jgi:hypothetical protein
MNTFLAGDVQSPRLLASARWLCSFAPLSRRQSRPFPLACCTGLRPVHVTPLQADEQQEENHVDSRLGFTDECNRATGGRDSHTGHGGEAGAMSAARSVASRFETTFFASF